MKVRRSLGLGVASLALLACATLANEAGDLDVARPNAHAGPFRLLREGELSSKDAPYVIKKRYSNYRDPTVLAEGTALGPTALFVTVSSTSEDAIYRFSAPDGRSFDSAPSPDTPVLAPSEAWEGGVVGEPSVARVGSEVWLAYSAAGGIGLARSSDGQSFVKDPSPVLTSGGGAWEAGEVPHAPALLVLPSGEVRLFFAAGERIGEASSAGDGVFERIGSEPVLEPGGTEFDGKAVGDPEAWLSETPEGRRVVRVYYTATAADGTLSIGVSARYGNDGRLEPAAAPSISGPRDPHAPAVLPRASLTLLFVTQRAGSSDSQDYPAIAAGVAPATVDLTLP